MSSSREMAKVTEMPKMGISLSLGFPLSNFQKSSEQPLQYQKTDHRTDRPTERGNYLGPHQGEPVAKVSKQ